MVEAKQAILRLEGLRQFTGIQPKSTIYLLMRQGRLPKPVKLGKRAVGWRVSDLERWAAEQKTAAELSAGQVA
jgi:prophage regulatory protein